MQRKRRRKVKKMPYLTGLIMKLAPKLGAKLVVEPEWKYAAQIIYPNGVVRSMRYYSLDLNHIASSDVARDKDYAKFFMKKLGFSVADGKTIFEDVWAKTVKSKRDISYAAKYAKKLGYPVIVKPNSKSQGADVALVWNEGELHIALHQIFKGDKVAIVERYLPGRDYRIVVLDGKIISAYERIALSVLSDGKSSILILLKEKQRKFFLEGRDTVINFQDQRMKMKLRREGYSFGSILPKGKRVYLLDNANLSTGGDSIDVTQKIHPGFKKIAVKLTRAMGLRMAGVDIMVTRGDIAKNPKSSEYYVIEINSSPGLDHYATTGTSQRRIVETMYLKILKALGKKD